jgi:hypothetical protein
MLSTNLRASILFINMGVRLGLGLEQVPVGAHNTLIALTHTYKISK